MASLRIGVIGLGLGNLHVQNYLASSDVTSIVVCDPDEGRRAQALSSSERVVGAFEDPKTMLAFSPLDAVSVVTPDHMHREHAQLCFDAGVDVLLTKPIATNHEDASAVVQAARYAGKRLMIAQECRFRTRFAFLRDLISSGALGDIINIRVDSIWDKREQFARAPWYASVEANRSIMVGTAIHEVDLLRFLTGETPVSVRAVGNSIGELAFPSEKTVAALFAFAGGTIGQVTASYEARWPQSGGRPDQLRILGSKGAVMGDEYVTDPSGQWQPLPGDENEFLTGVGRSVSAFVDVLANGAQIPVTGEDALASLELCLAVDRATRTGEVVVAPFGTGRQP